MVYDDSPLHYSALATVRLAHDLQNLLAIMAGCADSLAGRAFGLSPADRDFAELNEAIDSAFRLSRELLSAVGMHPPAEPMVLDVHEVIRRYRGSVQRLIGERVRLSIDLEAAVSLVEATPVQLEWILLNLAANGRDAMPNGGVLHIHTSSVERWTGPSDAPIRAGRYLRLTVRDEGSGLEDTGLGEDDSALVFEPFFTTKPHATGLGLTSVAVTVRGLKGWLYVDGSEKDGTSVHVLLPLFTAAV